MSDTMQLTLQRNDLKTSAISIVRSRLLLAFRELVDRSKEWTDAAPSHFAQGPKPTTIADFFVYEVAMNFLDKTSAACQESGAINGLTELAEDVTHRAIAAFDKWLDAEAEKLVTQLCDRYGRDKYPERLL